MQKKSINRVERDRGVYSCFGLFNYCCLSENVCPYYHGMDDESTDVLCSFPVAKEKPEEVTETQLRFTYHSPKEGQANKYKKLRDNALQFANMINSLCPDSRERSLSVTKLEECIMWANAAIARRE